MPDRPQRADHGISSGRDRSRLGISSEDHVERLSEFLKGNKFFIGRKQFGRQVILRYNAKRARQDIYAFVIPRNPQTEKQQANRLKFKAAMQAWAALTPAQKAVYEATARQRNLYGKNVFVRRFMLNNP